MTDSNTNRRTVWRYAAAAFASACLLSSVVGLYAYFSHTQNQYVVALASFAPILIVLSIVAAIVSAIGRRWVLLVASVTVAAAGAWLFGPLYVSDTSAAADGERTIEVMQSNLMLGLADPLEVTRLVNDHDVDVFTVQELTFDAEAALESAGIDDLLPYKFTKPTRSGGGGTGIYSRYPLSGERELPDFLLSNLVADLDVGAGRPLRVYSVHPVPPYPTAAAVWAAEMDLLRTEIARPTEVSDVIVSGDFNSTRSHSRFRDLLDEGYVDAADRTGSGLIATYPTDKSYPPIVGIDHILTHGVAAISLQRITLPGSDHHGLIAAITLGGS